MGGAKSREIKKELSVKLQGSTGCDERAVAILYARFIYLLIKPMNEKEQKKIFTELEKKYKMVETY